MLIQTFEERITAIKKYSGQPEGVQKRLVPVTFDDNEKCYNMELTKQEAALIAIFREADERGRINILHSMAFEHEQRKITNSSQRQQAEKQPKEEKLTLDKNETAAKNIEKLLKEKGIGLMPFLVKINMSWVKWCHRAKEKTKFSKQEIEAITKTLQLSNEQKEIIFS